MRQVTFGELYKWVLANKGIKTFMGYSNERIWWMLKEGIDEGTLLYNLNVNGSISGMILATKDVEKKILFVTENLAMSISTLRQFAKIAKERLPDYTLRAIRHCKERHWDTDKFYNKLIKS